MQRTLEKLCSTACYSSLSNVATVDCRPFKGIASEAVGTTGDLFNLGRFVSVQWFIFPQIEGLGHSSTSRHFAVKSLEEPREYLRHPALGPRLRQCAEAVLAVEGRTASESVFARVLEKYCQGRQDAGTILELERWKGK